MVKSNLTALLAGTVFGFGLCLSHMVDPQVVVSFLDVTGDWDPRLLMVMAGALCVSAVAFPMILKKFSRPVCDSSFHVPPNTIIDGKLIAGAVVFGVGWGLGGICPGPSVTALSFAMVEPWTFFGAMVVGMFLVNVWKR